MTLDYIIIVMVELALKNSCRNIHILKKLPNMVSLITKLTPWLNSHQKNQSWWYITCIISIVSKCTSQICHRYSVQAPLFTPL